MKKSLKIFLGVVGVIILIGILDLVFIFMVGRPILAVKSSEKNVYKGIFFDTYYCEEYSLPQIRGKKTKFQCYSSIKKVQDENSTHSFYGKVVDVKSTYIIVMPNEDEEESKTSDKFQVNLESSDAIYEIGTNVKVTYVGGILESYPAKVNTTKIELAKIKDFKLIYKESEKGKKQITDKKTNEKYDYNVYVYNGSMEIKINKKTYSLEEALKKGKITMSEIIEKANKDITNPLFYDDGGSVEYHYDDFTIIKMHTLDGNRDVYFGNKKLKLKDVK